MRAMKRLFILDFDNTVVLNPNYSSFIHLPLIGRLLPRKYLIASGAERVIGELKRRGDFVVILTKTTVLPVKRKMVKVRESGFEEMVDDVVVVRRKTPKVVKAIIERFPAEKAYMVGNSYRNDVEVALKSGITAVYIPRGRGESRKLLEKGGIREKVVVLDRFEEILALP